jgi:predicted nucleic acid-binding protein
MSGPPFAFQVPLPTVACGATKYITCINISIRTITSADVRASEAIRVQEGLMTNDSVTVALMRKLGLTAIATADTDFDNLSALRVYQPGDIP